MDDPGVIDEALLRALVDVSAGGLAVLDGQDRFVQLNAAAAQILGVPAAELAGRDAPFGTSDGCVVVWTAPDGRRRDLEYRSAATPGGGRVVWFGDVTDTRRQQERLAAIARAASSVADVGSLRATLDAVAREVARTATIAAVQIFAFDDPRDELRVLGVAGFGDVAGSDAAGFTALLRTCRQRGARVRFTDAFESREPVVVPHRKPVIMADPAWAPLHAIMDHPDWDTFVAVPMVVRGRALGVINAYYVPGEDPGPASLAFLVAMADQAAVAIDTATLLARTRSQARLDERRRLARDLHDSVVQQLFSMRTQATALRAQVDDERARRGADELAELAQRALVDLRGLVFELRPLDLAERGLVEAVRAHAAGLEARTGLVIDVDAPPALVVEPGAEAAEDLYRIVQEALHNVVKHARAAAVDIRFRMDGRWLTVEVSDDGNGPAAVAAGPAPETLGLVSMRERAARWGGSLVARPRPTGGWTVRATLPV